MRLRGRRALRLHHPRLLTSLGLLLMLQVQALVPAHAATAAAETVAAEAAPASTVPRGYLTLYLDNDLFGGTDRNYTNGVRASWISEGEPLLKFLPARRVMEQLAGADDDYYLVRTLSGFAEDSVRNGSLELNYGLSLTQLMFTPDDLESTTQPPGERRYAGWLGLGFSVHARDARALNSVEFIIGTTGPRSLAEEAQNFIHDLRDFDKFNGWDDQVPNAFTVDISYTQKRRLRFLDRSRTGLSMDGFSEWSARLGSFRTLAYAGGFMRIGFNLPADFSDPRISSNAYSHRFFEHGDDPRQPWSLYGLFGVRGTAIAFDATLDGPLLQDFNTGNERVPLIAEAFAGFGARFGAAEMSYVHTFRTEEFEEQGGGTDFGSLAFRLRL